MGGVRVVEIDPVPMRDGHGPADLLAPVASVSQRANHAGDPNLCRLQLGSYPSTVRVKGARDDHALNTSVRLAESRRPAYLWPDLVRDGVEAERPWMGRRRLYGSMYVESISYMCPATPDDLGQSAVDVP